MSGSQMKYDVRSAEQRVNGARIAIVRPAQVEAGALPDRQPGDVDPNNRMTPTSQTLGKPGADEPGGSRHKYPALFHVRQAFRPSTMTTYPSEKNSSLSREDTKKASG